VDFSRIRGDTEYRKALAFVLDCITFQEESLRGLKAQAEEVLGLVRDTLVDRGKEGASGAESSEDGRPGRADWMSGSGRLGKIRKPE
jgi:hypothetical protein